MKPPVHYDLQYILDEAFAKQITADGRDAALILSEQAACRKPQTDPALRALVEFRAGPAKHRMEITRPGARRNVLKNWKKD